MRGEQGGRDAAVSTFALPVRCVLFLTSIMQTKLSTGIQNFLRTSPSQSFPPGAKIWTIMFFSKTGLENTLNKFVSHVTAIHAPNT